MMMSHLRRVTTGMSALIAMPSSQQTYRRDSMTKKEMKLELENDLFYGNYLHKINGGFAAATETDEDEDYVYFKFEYGEQDLGAGGVTYSGSCKYDKVDGTWMMD
jgi:hypothetical protein